MTIGDKLKEKVKDAKDKVVSTTENVSDTVRGKAHEEEGVAGTGANTYKDPTREYDEEEPMSPAKIREHEPTAVSRDASDQKITEPGKTGINPEEAAEKARRSGMTKGTAGAAETGSEYEQGAAGSNK